MTARRTLLVLVTLVAVCAVGGSAIRSPVAGAESTGPIDLDDVAAVSKAMADAGTVRFSGRTTVTLTDTQALTEYSVAGARDFVRGRTSWTATSIAAPADGYRLVSIGDTTYLAVDSLRGPIPEAARGKQWIRLSPGADGPPGGVTGPRREFDLTHQPGLEFSQVGVDRLGGAKVTRVHLQWPVVLPSVTLSTGFVVPPKTETQRVDLWLDGKGRLRQESSVLLSRPGPRTASVRTLLQYFGYGKRVRISAPGPAATIDEGDLEADALPLV